MFGLYCYSVLAYKLQTPANHPAEITQLLNSCLQHYEAQNKAQNVCGVTKHNISCNKLTLMTTLGTASFRL
jgi:hypothetical protein